MSFPVHTTSIIRLLVEKAKFCFFLRQETSSRDVVNMSCRCEKYIFISRFARFSLRSLFLFGSAGRGQNRPDLSSVDPSADVQYHQYCKNGCLCSFSMRSTPMKSFPSFIRLRIENDEIRRPLNKFETQHRLQDAGHDTANRDTGD